ncbi:erythromycin esterase family protein [Bacillaceae bacterium S4-13-58]
MNKILEGIKKHSKSFKAVEDLEPIIDEVGDARVVLLGESSHGTSEFYEIRAELSKRLIEEKGFKAICVEVDWPASYQVNRYIKGYDKTFSAPNQALQSFQRWPTWMWANEEISEFIEWIKDYNGKSQDSYPKNNVGFYPSGAVKFTISEMIGGFLQVQGGRLTINVQPLTHV